MNIFKKLYLRYLVSRLLKNTRKLIPKKSPVTKHWYAGLPLLAWPGTHYTDCPGLCAVAEHTFSNFGIGRYVMNYLYRVRKPFASDAYWWSAMTNVKEERELKRRINIRIQFLEGVLKNNLKIF